MTSQLDPQSADRQSPDAQLTAQARKSAVAVGVVLLVIAAWNFWKGRPAVYYPFALIGASLLIISRVWDAGARGFHHYWMKFAGGLGYINARILLSLMFYLVITPYGLVSRLVRRNPLRRRGPPQESYWIPRKTLKQEHQQFERLF